MRDVLRRVITVIAVVASISLVNVELAGAAVADDAFDVTLRIMPPTTTDDCTQASQDAGTCIGFITTDDSDDPVVAVIAAALGDGGVPAAARFYEGARQFLDANTIAFVDQAFDLEAVAEGEGAELLYDSLGIARAWPDVREVGVDAGDAGRRSPQAQNGHCCAVSNVHWAWHGGPVVVRYGYCESHDMAGPHCGVLGYFDADVRSDIQFFPDADWSHYFSYRSGQRPKFSDLKVKMKRDVTHKADPAILTLNCSESGQTMGCETWATSPNVAGNYYYYELNATVWCQCGRPSQHLQIQTRRWYIGSPYPEYPAYDNGG